MTESRQPDTVMVAETTTAPHALQQNIGGVPQRPRTNGSAVASLVLGIVWLWGLGAVLALIFGYKGKREIDKSAGAEGGRGLAIAGIVLGWIGIVLPVLGILLAVLVFAVGGSSPNKAQQTSCRAEKSVVEAATEAYRAQNGVYPATTSQLVGTFLREMPAHYTVSGSTITGTGPCN